jgi:hypothetical protein
MNGQAIGHFRGQQAADNAGNTWKYVAFGCFMEYAKTHQEFTTEQVREAYPHMPAPPDTRAWGHIAVQAKKAGVVEAAGWVRATSPKVHGMVVTQWKSKIYLGESND